MIKHHLKFCDDCHVIGPCTHNRKCFMDHFMSHLNFNLGDTVPLKGQSINEKIINDDFHTDYLSILMTQISLMRIIPLKR